MNGIEDIISRVDLADRGVFLTLAPIGEQQRRSETELWREFDSARPRILGAMLDAAARGLQALPGVRLPSLPRMADFAEQRCGPPAPLRTPMMQTAKPRSKASSRRTQWQFASGDSSRNAAVGQERRRTFCASPPIFLVTISRKKARTGQDIPAPSPAGCVACKLPFACWA